MVTYYWVGVSNANWGTPGNWSLTSGGTQPATTIPTAADNVIFDNNSRNCTINITTAVCGTITWQAYTNTITFINGLTVSGNVILGASMTFAGAGQLSINANAVLTTNGKILNLPLAGTVSTTITLADDLYYSGTIGQVNLTLNQTSPTLGNVYFVNGGFNTSAGMQYRGSAILNFGSGSFLNCGTGANIYNNIVINAGSGIFTLGSGILAYYGSSFIYVSGTCVVGSSTTLKIYTSATLNCNGNNSNSLTSTSGINFANVLVMTNAITITLASHFAVNVSLSSQANLSSFTITGAYDIYIGGNFSPSYYAWVCTGVTLYFCGTGTWSGNSANTLSANITINTAGTLNISGAVSFDTGTLTYIAGTVITTGSTLTITNTTATLNTVGIAWNNITTHNSGTLTINSLLSINGTLNINGYTIFNGTAGWYANTVANISNGIGQGYVLGAGLTYTVTTLLQNNRLNSTQTHDGISSTLSGTQANLILLPGCVCDNLWCDIKDINSSGGKMGSTFRGVLTNATNWQIISTIDIYTTSATFVG
jgi:hypothetical protein